MKKGLNSTEAIDAAVEAWRRSDTRLSLREWLGMTEAEYGRFIQQVERVVVIENPALRRHGLAAHFLARARGESQHRTGNAGVTDAMREAGDEVKKQQRKKRRREWRT